MSVYQRVPGRPRRDQPTTGDRVSGLRPYPRLDIPCASSPLKSPSGSRVQKGQDMFRESRGKCDVPFASLPRTVGPLYPNRGSTETEDRVHGRRCRTEVVSPRSPYDGFRSRSLWDDIPGDIQCVGLRYIFTSIVGVYLVPVPRLLDFVRYPSHLRFCKVQVPVTVLGRGETGDVANLGESGSRQRKSLEYGGKKRKGQQL